MKDSNDEQRKLTQVLMNKYNVNTKDLESLTNDEGVTL